MASRARIQILGNSTPSQASQQQAESPVVTCARRHSSAVSAHTPTVMTVNGFQRGESGGDKSACDGHFHSNDERIVALSSGWLRLDGTRRCNRMIRITRGGRSVVAKVVDEGDSSRGCDDNIALGLDTDVGRFPVTWSDA
ncbi:hypothetical protein HU200_049522 [Digitaria exilis]|uniref:Ripening-related protein grip22 n=1 Tax=Digitaria exilis TaxID=1010633 RepID=A0A835AQ93_9POAL|nr:hypothetical protein HU200_049522 [Digitaria exilis]